MRHFGQERGKYPALCTEPSGSLPHTALHAAQANWMVDQESVTYPGIRKFCHIFEEILTRAHSRLDVPTKLS